MVGCSRTRLRKQPITALYFEFESEPGWFMVQKPRSAMTTYKKYETGLSRTLDNPVHFLAHLSQRLLCELIVHQWLRRPSDNIFKHILKFHMETP